MLTVSPNRQYRGIVVPTTPATTEPRNKEFNSYRHSQHAKRARILLYFYQNQRRRNQKIQFLYLINLIWFRIAELKVSLQAKDLCGSSEQGYCNWRYINTKVFDPNVSNKAGKVYNIISFSGSRSGTHRLENRLGSSSVLVNLFCYYMSSILYQLLS